MRIIIVLFVPWLSAVPSIVAADDAATVEEVAKYPHPRKPPVVLSSLAPGGSLLAMKAEEETAVTIIEPLTGKEVRRVEAAGIVLWLAFSGNGKTLAIATSNPDSRLQVARTGFWSTSDWMYRALFLPKLLPWATLFASAGVCISCNGSSRID